MAKVKNQTTGLTSKRQKTKILVNQKKDLIEKVKIEKSRCLSLLAISKSLGISESTIRGILKNEDKIMKKLEANPNTDATV